MLRYLLVLCALVSSLSAQGLEYVRANYTKFEYRIPMRDGKNLFTCVYTPKDASKSYPILLNRTPYSIAPYGSDNYKDNLGPSVLFGKDAFIFVYQDVRGRNMSEGEFVDMRPHKDHKQGQKEIDESTDTYDTIEWLVKNVPNNNGRVGMWGISYPGFYASAGMIDAHPALKAVSPQAPIADWFIGDDFHHNGTLYLPHAFWFMSVFGRPHPEPGIDRPQPLKNDNPDGYSFFLKLGPLSNVNEKWYKNDIAFWNEVVRHPNYDEFWQARNLRPHLKNIKPAVLTVGGWFDAEDLFGALNTYKSVEKQSPGAWNALVMGPWSHGQWARGEGDHLGNVNFGSKTSEFYRENIELPFFRYYLKDAAEPKLPEAFVFETGSNQWRRYDAWPPKEAHAAPLYFHPGGKLSFDAPKEATGFDEYVSDPARPVPYISGTAIHMAAEHMTEDQRFAAARPDVLVYQTDELTEDTILAGPLTARLNVSTTGTDSDFVVKLIDVYPDTMPDNPAVRYVKMGGYQQLVRGEAMRGRFRKSYEKPEPFEPGKVEKVEWTLPDINHNFRRGHRIMIQVQSTWFPLVDRNPQKFVDIYNARPEDFQKATERVYHTREAASSLVVNVLR